MNRIIIYVRWILLAVILLAAGICYSCGMDRSAVGRVSAAYESDDGMQAEAGAAPESETNGNSDSVGTLAEPEESTVCETVPLRICYVHVCGEVVSPGVYQIPEGSRIYEAVQAAGGFTQEADLDYLNLAEIVQDGMKIVVPDRQSETTAAAGIYMAGSGVSGSISSENGSTAGGKVNINTADSTELMTLSGIGKARAAAIIQYREEHGRFSSIEEIMQVPGIKEAAFQKIKQDIEVSYD